MCLRARNYFEDENAAFTQQLLTFTGRQTRHKSRSANANDTRKVLVGDLMLRYPNIAMMIKQLPTIPSSKVRLEFEDVGLK